jgi:hypothetical protein
VSLWYVINGTVGSDLAFDATEMNSCKWLSLDEVLATDSSELDPHMHRFIKKMKQNMGTKKRECTYNG